MNFVFLRNSSVIGLCLVSALASADNLRIGTWNISSYTGSNRAAEIQNSIFGQFQGRSFSPDVLFAQEIQSVSAANTLKSVMNSASGSTGDWDVMYGSLTGTNSTSDTAMFFRTGKVTALAPTLVLGAGGTSANPRDSWRFDFKINGNSSANEVMSVYNVHMKSGSSSDDQNRRQIEAQAIRANANSLAADHQIMVLGDFNWQTSSQSAFGTLSNAGSNSRGQFFDPINTLGSWNNNANYRFVHTQDPSGAGGMDDRLDMIMMGGGLGDGIGTDYLGAFGTSYSTSTWNDANHSYRVWGNDGTSFDAALTTTGNGMVGSSIAQSLIDVAGINGGHLPVFADLKYDAVPEPATLTLLGVAALAALRRRNRISKS